MIRALWGAAAIALYVVAALVYQGPIRPVFDGLGPPPAYNYVKPPPDLADTNRPAPGGSGVIEVVDEQLVGRTIPTADAQMLVIFGTGSADLPTGSTITVTIEPLDPAPLPEPPEGLLLYGNAYRVTAVDDATGEPVEIRESMDIVLRYPVHAIEVLHLDEGRWVRLESAVAEASLQLFASTEALGIFITAGPPIGPARPWLPYVVGAASVAAALWGLWVGRGRPPLRYPRRLRKGRT